MTIIAKGLTGLLTLVTFAMGGAWFFLGISTMEVIGGQDLTQLRTGAAYGFADNAVRFFAGIWIATGVGLIYCLRDFTNRTLLLRIIMGGLFLGGVGRVLSMVQFGMIDAMVPPTVLELLLPPIIIWAQSRART